MISFQNFDCLIEPVLVVESNGLIVYCNEAFAKMAGISLGRLIGKKNIQQLSKDQHIQILCGKNSDKLNVYHEVTFSFSEGNPWRVQFCSQALSVNGQPDQFLTFFKDVTLEERLHRKYRNELISNQALIQKLDKKLFASQFLLSILEMTSAATSAGSLIYQLLDKICDEFKFAAGGYVVCEDAMAEQACTIKMSRSTQTMNNGQFHQKLNEIVHTHADKMIAIYAVGNPTVGHFDGHHLLFIPFSSEKNKQHILVFFVDEKFELQVDMVELFSHLMKQVDLALENRALYEESITDEKTQVYNPRYFKMSLRRHWDQAQEAGQHLSLLMLDIDFFKKINDQHGHPMGDMVLFEVAKLIKKGCRVTDTVVRYGGEEFALILPDTNAGGAFIVAERIRQSVQEMSLVLVDGSHLKTTISIGVASTKTFSGAAEDILSEADQALYKAKQNGRNQTVIYSTMMDSDQVLKKKVV